MFLEKKNENKKLIIGLEYDFFWCKCFLVIILCELVILIIFIFKMKYVYFSFKKYIL